MISMVLPLHVGNAMQLLIEPPAGAVVWRVLRKASPDFAGHDDPTALLVYEGDERAFIDSMSLQNEVMQFYCAFYSADQISWVPSQVANGTPTADYVDRTTDVLSIMRDRLEAGLLVECQRGNFLPELGYIQVYTAPPSLEQDLRFPLVTLHLESESPTERGIGEMLAPDQFDAIGFDWDESEGWLASVRLTIIGWSLNSDERLELRKAIRRLVVANLPVFAGHGWVMPELVQQDVDAINGEYPSPMYQVMSTFSCVAPVCVSGTVSAVREIFTRNING